jgi:hypothetical protein
MALPIATRRRVRQVRRKAVLAVFTVLASGMGFSPEAKEKDLHPRRTTTHWAKVSLVCGHAADPTVRALGPC